MRMRKKPNLVPRMARCGDLLVPEPESLRGRWLAAFPGYRELRLELGCGKGRFTAETAKMEPEIFFAALERVPDAMVVGMERVFEAGLKNVRFLDTDVIRCGEIFAPGEVGRVYVNFCDPWPKTKQHKRRLTAPALLRLDEGILAPGGELWFKTDNRPLFEWSLDQLAAEGWDLLAVTTDLHEKGPAGVMTDYELKFYEQGVPINRCVARRPDRIR